LDDEGGIQPLLYELGFIKLLLLPKSREFAKSVVFTRQQGRDEWGVRFGH
jgi:hypothetical protein